MGGIQDWKGFGFWKGTLSPQLVSKIGLTLRATVTSIIGSGHCQSEFWGQGLRGCLWTARRPSLVPRPPHRFTLGCTHSPIWMKTQTSWAWRRTFRAFWLSHSLPRPSCLIDGDYYIIDLMDRTMPALGTVCSSSKPAQGLAAPTVQSLLPSSTSARRTASNPGRDTSWATFPGGPGAMS